MTGTPVPCDEQARQDALLRALRTTSTPIDLCAQREPDLRLAAATSDGLRAYRGHAQALAPRVLQAAYPTLCAMLGDDALAALAQRLWAAAPPQRGDLGEWGEGLAALITGQLAPDAEVATTLSPWPWLSDVARLDWARHQAGRCAVHPVDAGALQRLSHADPGTLRLVLQPGMKWVWSPWPVDALWQAHRLPTHQQADAAHKALSGVQADGPHHLTLVIWSATVPGADGLCQTTLPPEDAQATRLLADPSLSLADALLGAPAGFDFGRWFTQALSCGWLLGTTAFQGSAQ